MTDDRRTMTPHTPAWVTALLGEQATCTRVIGGGTSRTTLLLDVPPHPGGVVARHDAGIGPLAGTPFTLRREADTYRTVATTEVPVPMVIALAEDGMSFAMDEVAGTVDRGAAALDDYLRLLGTLHLTGVDAAPAGHAGFDVAGHDDLSIWHDVADSLINRPAPLVAEAFMALERHGAADIERPTLCHGDAGYGNYLHIGAAVTGLIDWEMAHTGDPHDDLASVAVRAALCGIDLGDYRARIGWHWEPASGSRFDPHRYLLGVTGTLTRMIISCLVALDHPRADIDRTTQLMGLPLMEAHLLRVLSALDGRELGPLPHVTADTTFTAEIADLLAEPSERSDDHDGPRRRRAYLAAQLDQAAHADRRLPSNGSNHTDLTVMVAARLAALPGSRDLANARIPEVAPCGTC